MNKIVKKNINLDKKYCFPDNICTVHHKDKIIVISVDTANWLVLDNENQLDFFYLLKSNTLGKSLELFDGNKNDAVNVVIQIEAKSFENKDTKRTPEGSIFIYLTNACNMRCPHCYMYADLKKENELILDEIISILTEFKKQGGNKVTFSGGEVTMRKDFAEIINKTFELGYKIEVLTNGTLWASEMIDLLSKKISEIQISIDGYCEEENAHVRGKGNFQKSLDTVDKFVKNNVATTVACTPFFDDSLEQKIGLYSDFAKNLIQKYKGKNFKVIFTADLIDGREIKFSPIEKNNYSNIIKKIYENIYGITSDSSFIERNKSHSVLNNCSFGNLYVSSIGDIFACSRIFEINPFANIRKNSFEEIMLLSQNQKNISDVNNLHPCKDCELKYICGGGCRLVYFSSFPQENNTRTCSKSNKEHFYDLMIKVNKDLYQ